MINLEDITALIITSAVKNSPEISKDLHSVSEVTENLNFLKETIANIRENTSINKFLIVHDFKVDSFFSIMHHKNIVKLKEIYKINLLISPSSIKMPSQLTASNAFKLGLKNVKDKFFLFWEHDHLFSKKLNWDIVNNCFANKGKLIKFNRKLNIINTKNSLQKQEILEKGSVHYITQSDIPDTLKTNFYCNGPFISETNFCRDLWNDVNFEIPDWNGPFGGFIEGPVAQKMLENQLNLSERQFREKYPIYIYGSSKDKPIVFHRGIYYPKYKFNFLKISSYINILKILKKKSLMFLRKIKLNNLCN